MIPRIVNFVCNCDLQTNLNLKYITNNSIDVVYNPKKFSAIVKRFRSPKSTILIFPNGKLTITGSTTEDDARTVAKKTVHMLNKLGYSCSVNHFRISNIVATVDLKEIVKKQTGTIIDLNRLATLNLKLFKYQPERFSALTTDINGIKAVIFHNGKVNFTGAKDVFKIYETFDELLTLLLENNFVEIM